MNATYRTVTLAAALLVAIVAAGVTHAAPEPDPRSFNVKGAAARYTYTLETKKGIFSVWIYWAEQKYYLQERRPKQEILFTLLPEKMAEGKTLVTPSDKLMQVLRTAFRNGNAWFDTAKTRNAFIEIFKR